MHPRDVDADFAHGKTTNWFGGSSNASTQLLDEMPSRGMVRVARPHSSSPLPACRTPFDPIVHDRWQFERLWGWRYRFEGYTPPSRRRLGYYALPLLWGDRVIGWGNLSVEAGEIRITIGYVDARAPTEAWRQENLGAELAHACASGTGRFSGGLRPVCDASDRQNRLSLA